MRFFRTLYETRQSELLAAVVVVVLMLMVGLLFSGVLEWLDRQQLDEVLWGAAVVLFATGLYLLPTIVAFQRDGVPHRWSVAALNVFLGWTIVGWAVALAMAVRDRPAPATPTT